MRRVIFGKLKNFFSLFGSFGTSGSKWVSGALAPNGKIYCIPFNSTQVLVIDPSNDTTSLFGNLSGIGKWVGGVLAPNGKIYGIPFSSTQVLVIDPLNDTTSLFGNLSGGGKWQSGVLAPNGKIYYMASNSSQFLVIDTKSLPATADLQIPTNLADLPTSNYNKYFNKF